MVLNSDKETRGQYFHLIYCWEMIKAKSVYIHLYLLEKTDICTVIKMNTSFLHVYT
jgi:hypothetical protein